jgi:hypothetical protein
VAKVHHSAIVTRDVEGSLASWRNGLMDAAARSNAAATAGDHADATKRFKMKEYERV